MGMGTENNGTSRSEGTRERGMSELWNEINAARMYHLCRAMRREER